MIGFEGNPFKRKSRKVTKQSTSATQFSPFKGNFRWRRH